MLCQSFKNESVQFIAEQEEFESRRLWRHSRSQVKTECKHYEFASMLAILYLRFNEIDLATKSKSTLEHRLREESSDTQRGQREMGNKSE